MTFTLPKLIGHRGVAARAPENTLLSFTLAADLGLTWIELDIFLTADEELVVLHDRTLGRRTSGRGDVTQKTMADLVGLDAGEGEPIPTLRQILALCRNRSLGVNIELKENKGREAQTLRVLQKLLDHFPEIAVLISSFDQNMLSMAKQELPQVARGFLWEALPGNWQDLAAQIGCRSIHLDEAQISPDKIPLIREAGYLIAAYTVNNPARAEKLFNWGIDALFTDLPPAMDSYI